MRVLANAVAVRLTPANGDGSAKRRARRSSSMEAVRAEIEKDAQALVGLTSAHAALAATAVEREAAAGDLSRWVSSSLILTHDGDGT